MVVSVHLEEHYCPLLFEMKNNYAICFLSEERFARILCMCACINLL